MAIGRKRKKGQNKRSFAIAALRRASLRWPARSEAIRKARVDRGLYKCASCLGLFKNGEFQLDHIKPVVDIKKEQTTMDDYIDSLLCDVDGFSVLCHPCHEGKTLIENNMRVVKRNSE